jgi:cytochrome c oxidase subunit II
MDAIRRRILAGAAAVGAVALGVRAAEERVIKVRVHKFAFEPAQIALKKGEPVTLEFTTADVFMGFNAPDFGVRTDIVPGKEMRVRIAPDKAGTFPFLCDVFCGDGHETMSGAIVVT